MSITWVSLVLSSWASGNLRVKRLPNGQHFGSFGMYVLLLFCSYTSLGFSKKAVRMSWIWIHWIRFEDIWDHLHGPWPLSKTINMLPYLALLSCHGRLAPPTAPVEVPSPVSHHQRRWAFGRTSLENLGNFGETSVPWSHHYVMSHRPGGLGCTRGNKQLVELGEEKHGPSKHLEGRPSGALRAEVWLAPRRRGSSSISLQFS